VAARSAAGAQPAATAARLGLSARAYDDLLTGLARAVRDALVDRELSVLLDLDGVPRA
jgi:hypothetical protein